MQWFIDRINAMNPRSRNLKGRHPKKNPKVLPMRAADWPTPATAAGKSTKSAGVRAKNERWVTSRKSWVPSAAPGTPMTLIAIPRASRSRSFRTLNAFEKRTQASYLRGVANSPSARVLRAVRYRLRKSPVRRRGAWDGRRASRVAPATAAGAPCAGDTRGSRRWRRLRPGPRPCPARRRRGAVCRGRQGVVPPMSKS